jgi:multicomponent Na+:H+ antiporter subunit G
VSALEIAAAVLIGLGSLFMLATAVGVVRFPDFYTRLHAAGKGDTLGQGLVLLGLCLVADAGPDLLKLLAIVFFVFILNPTATHALARAAWVSGLQPWTRGGSDEPEEGA